MSGHGPNTELEFRSATRPVMTEAGRLTLSKAWEDVCDQFFRQTGRHLISGTNGKAGVLQRWQNKYEKEAETSSKGDKLGKVLQKLLDGIEVIGAFVAQAASVVFAPAGMCFNAIAFLIDVPRQLRKVYDCLHELFEEVTGFMVEFKILKRIDDDGLLNEDLVLNTNKVLVSFIKICILSIRLLDGSKILTVMKVMFLKNDSGVSAELETFRKLVQNHSTLTGTVTLEHVVKSQRDVEFIRDSSIDTNLKISMLAADQELREAKVQEQKLLSEIEGKLFSTQSLRERQHHPVNIEVDKMTSECYENLKKEIEDRNWKSGAIPQSKLIVLSGGVGSGKSSAIRALCKSLVDANKELAPRSSEKIIASFDFASASKVHSSAMQSDILQANVMRSLAFQVARQNIVYARSLQKRLQQYTDTHLTAEFVVLWARLHLDWLRFNDTHKLYLLFDGITLGNERTAKTILDRMLFSKNQSSLWKPVQAYVAGDLSWPGQSVSILNLENVNSGPIRSFIDNELRDLKIFEGNDRRSVKQRSYVLSNLPKHSCNSFDIARQKLRILHQAVFEDASEKKLEDIITDNVLSDDDEQAQRTLKSLSNNLSEYHVDQLNCLLMWQIYNKLGRPFWLEDLDTCCYLSQNKRTLEPLAHKLQSRYSEIFMPHDTTWIVRPEIYAYLKKSEDRVIEESSEPKFSLTVSIHNAPEKDVRRFILELDSQLETGKLDILAQSQALNKSKISINRSAAHYDISMTCLRLLNNSPQETTKFMFRYARDYLPRHLGELKSVVERISAQQKLELVQALVEYLSDPYFVEQETNSLWDAREVLQEEDSIAAIGFWLIEAEALPGVLPRHKRWISKTINSRNKLSFLHPIALVAMRRWAGLNWPQSQVKTFPVKNYSALFRWLETYITEAGVLDFGNTPVIGDIKEKTTTETISEMVEWIMKQLDNSDEVRRWMMIGGALFFKEHSAAAIPYFKKCLDSDHHWRALLSLSKAHAELRDLTARDNTLKDFVKGRSESFAVEELHKDEEEEYITEATHLAENYEREQEYDEAMKLYEMILRKRPQNLTSRWSTIRILCAEAKHSDLVALLKRWRDSPNDYGGKPPAASCLDLAESFGGGTPVKDVVRVIRDEQVRATIFELFSEASGLATNNGSFKQVELLFCQGAAGAMSAHTKMREQGHNALCILLKQPRDYSYSYGRYLLRESSGILALSKFNSIWNEYRSARKDDSHIAMDYATSLQAYIDLVSPKSLESMQEENLVPPKSYIASVYSMFNQQSLIKDHFRDILFAALDLLEDEDPSNDGRAIANLIRIFCTLGDRRSALITFSLGKSRRGSFRFKCCFCHRSFDSFTVRKVWLCQFCITFAICPTCHGKHGLDGHFWPTWRCDSSHIFIKLHYLDHDDGNAQAGKINIDYDLTEDECGNVTRAGGSVVDIKEWFKIVREDWKPTKVGATI